MTEESEFTVVGMWWESAERWQDHFTREVAYDDRPAR